MEYLLPHATDRQKELISAAISEGSYRKAAKKLGVSVGTIEAAIRRAQSRAALALIDPDQDLHQSIPDGQIVKGTSTLIDMKTNTSVMQWIKTDTSAEQRLVAYRNALDGLIADLPKLPPEKFNGNASGDLIAFYPLGDPHIGMRSWHEECGDDWDLAIAEKAFVGVFDRLVRSAPRCKRAVILNLGDFFHADNVAGVTERSGHHLDLDGRYAKMVRIGMKVIRRLIHSALEHHETVTVINAIGNHDDTGAMFLSIALEHIYELEPRVTVDSSPAPFHYVRHGKCLVGAHHGHSCKADKLPMVMATDRAADWGETEFRYWYTGHTHQDKLKEHPGCKVESFRTLAAKDAYATWHGYRSGQDSKCIVLHKDFGEVERHTVSLAMIHGKKAA